MRPLCWHANHQGGSAHRCSARSHFRCYDWFLYGLSVFCLCARTARAASERRARRSDGNSRKRLVTSGLDWLSPSSVSVLTPCGTAGFPCTAWICPARLVEYNADDVNCAGGHAQVSPRLKLSAVEPSAAVRTSSVCSAAVHNAKTGSGTGRKPFVSCSTIPHSRWYFVGQRF